MKKLFASITGSPVGWGAVLTIVFYAAIRRDLLTNETIIRYTSGHPVEYVTVFMFFVGMIGLLFKWLGVQRQQRLLRFGLVFPPIRREKESLEKVDDYLATLNSAMKVRGNSLHLLRLRAILDFLKTTDSPEDIDQELRYLADESLDRSDADYGLARMFIWAIPILGFLGTVMGITMALGNLNLTELETTGKHLAAGLQVAFDTTALALSLVFVLYFSLFIVRGQETVLYRKVEDMVDREIRGRFILEAGGAKHEELDFVRRAMQSIVDSFELLMKRQTAVWSEAIDHVNARVAKITVDGATQIEKILAASLEKSIGSYAEKMIEGQEALLNATVAPLMATLEKKTEKLGSFKDQMLEQSRILLEVLRATGEITRLEDRLNHNLNALAGAGQFEKTVNSLAATIHLLNGKLSHYPQAGQEIRLAASPEIAGPAGCGRRNVEAHILSISEPDSELSDNPQRS